MSIKKRKKVIFSASGTGGHLFPAQTVAKQLTEHCDILFVAGSLASNPYFDVKNYDFEEISCATFSFKNPLKVLQGGIKVAKGILQARHILNRFSPDLVVGFGSFFTLPLLVAALSKKVPILLHEQNAIPGKVNRLFSYFAKTTAITFPESASYLKGPKVEVNFPIRTKVDPNPPVSAWDYFDLSPNKMTLLLFGGSQGAQAMNHLFFETLPLITSILPPFQLLHFTGRNGSVENAKNCYRSFGIAHCVKEFESRMDLALSIADLALTRAGASTIAELVDSETPAILIPFPFATENHQVKNAEYFVKNVQGGQMLLESKATPSELAKTFRELLESLKDKKEQISIYKMRKQLSDLSELIIKM